MVLEVVGADSFDVERALFWQFRGLLEVGFVLVAEIAVEDHGEEACADHAGNGYYGDQAQTPLGYQGD